METQAGCPESASHWNNLHRQPRFRPQYPTDHVIRFVLGHFGAVDRTSLRAIDIGVGGGRHTKLLCELGFQTTGIDHSAEGLRQCELWLSSLSLRATLKQTDMTRLPFANEAFDVAISYGVYYYADSAGIAQAVSELHRVLRPGALALVVLRTTDDYRFGKGTMLEKNTFRVEIEDTNELGCVVHFVSESDVARLFSSFADVRLEKTETTSCERSRVDSDWLVTVKK